MLVFMICGLVSSTPNAYAAEGDVFMGASVPYSLLFPGATYSTHYYTMELADGEKYTAYCIEANKGILNQGSYSLNEVTLQSHPLLVE